MLPAHVHRSAHRSLLSMVIPWNLTFLPQSPSSLKTCLDIFELMFKPTTRHQSSTTELERSLYAIKHNLPRTTITTYQNRQWTWSPDQLICGVARQPWDSTAEAGALSPSGQPRAVLTEITPSSVVVSVWPVLTALHWPYPVHSYSMNPSFFKVIIYWLMCIIESPFYV